MRSVRVLFLVLLAACKIGFDNTNVDPLLRLGDVRGRDVDMRERQPVRLMRCANRLDLCTVRASI